MGQNKWQGRESRTGLLKFFTLLLIGGVGLSTSAKADEQIAKQLTNPVADLISVPFQSNFDFNVGPSDGFRNTTNIQPVVPIKLNSEWNLIGRTILPVITQNDTFGDSGDQTGISDTLQSFFLSPQAAPPTPLGNLAWGVGPATLIPTSTHRLLGPSTFAMGPTGVFLFLKGGWTYGALANHLWGIEQTRDNIPDLNQTYVQPFVAYTTKSAWTFAAAGELSYDWRNGEWIGPLNFDLAKTTTIGNQVVQFQGRARYHVATNAYSPHGWGFTFNTTFVFPTK